MENKKTYILLCFIFLLTLGFRLYFTLQTENFSSDEAYFHLRQIENIIENKNLVFYDDLSYGGRDVIYPPFFHALMAVLSFGQIFLLKIIPEIFLAATVFVVFFVCKSLTQDNLSSLFSTTAFSFIPLFIGETINKLSVYSILIPTIFLLFYFLSDLKRYATHYIIFSFILALTHPIAFLFVIALLFYVLLCLSEEVEISGLKKEAIVFSIVLVLLIQFIFYKKAFLEYGLAIMWQNIPANILADSFRSLTLFESVFYIGIIPLILGIIGIYIGVFQKKNKLSLLISSLILSTFLLLILRLMPITEGLLILGLALAVLSSLTLKTLFNYTQKLRFAKLKIIIPAMIFILIVIFSIWPSYLVIKNVSFLHDQVINDMEWIKENTGKRSVVLANINEGNLITAIAERRNVIDSNFLLAPHPKDRLEDVNLLYSTQIEAKSIELLKKYNINIIYLSEETKNAYNIETLLYYNKDCFQKRRIRIYEFVC